MCVYCNETLHTLGYKNLGDVDSRGGLDSYTGEGYIEFLDLKTCQKCGWWVISRNASYTSSIDWWTSTRHRWSSLLNLDISDISVGMDELRTYLIAKYDERFNLNPRRFEDIVGGVFSDLDYKVRVTSFSGDDGIDLVALDGQANDLVGIQVKRYKNKIGVEQIRSFDGALDLAGMNQGIFITTSQYTTGAKLTAERYRMVGRVISLWDAETFYDKLKITQRKMYKRADEKGAPFYDLWQNPPDSIDMAVAYSSSGVRE